MARKSGKDVVRLQAEVSLQRLLEERGVELRPKGKVLLGQCPLHPRGEPRELRLDPQGNTWSCPTCGTDLTVIDWVVKAEGISRRHAIQVLQQGITSGPRRPTGRTGQAGTVKKSTVTRLPPPVDPAADDAQLLLQVVDFYHQTLKESPEAITYLEGRGLKSLEMVEALKLGFANRTLAYRLPSKNRKAGKLIRERLTRLEVANLKLVDVDAERQTVFVRQGKGRKDRLVPIGTRALAWLHKYLQDARPELVAAVDPGHVFLTNVGKPFDPQHLAMMVRKRLDSASIEKPGSCHLFRHTVATLMLENGADVRYVQELLGHTDLSVTQVYTHVSIRKLQQVHAETHPGANLEKGSTTAATAAERADAGADAQGGAGQAQQLLEDLAAEGEGDGPDDDDPQPDRE